MVVRAENAPMFFCAENGPMCVCAAMGAFASGVTSTDELQISYPCYCKLLSAVDGLEGPVVFCPIKS